jgi:hypothetical protein
MVALYDSQFSSTHYERPLKRKRPNETSGNDTQHINKKRKPHHPPGPPPSFWVNLSGSLLTKNALRELDRRNTTKYLAGSLSPSHRSCGKREDACPYQAHKFLEQISSTDWAQLKRFARHGGPNLKDLRGVRKHLHNPRQCPY